MIKLATTYALLSLCALPTFAQEKRSSIELQLFVQSEIENRMVNNTLSFVNFEELKVVQTVPIEAHPMIFEGDGIYVACITVASVNGDEYPVDIYLMDTGGGLRAIQMTFGQGPRDQLKSMMDSGFFTKFN